MTTKKVVCTAFLIFLTACNKETPWPTQSTSPLASPSVSWSPSTLPLPSDKPSSVATVPSVIQHCETIPTTERLTYGNKTIERKLPMAGRFTVESHIKTAGEKYSGPNHFPKNATEGIATHLALHKAELAKSGLDIKKVYPNDPDKPWFRQWTPKENEGEFGESSVDDPSITEETWTMNMQEEEAVVGKYLASFNGHNVVVLKKFETGPEDQKWLGGMQPAPFYVLGADDESLITLGRLKDQTLPLGPIKCAGNP